MGHPNNHRISGVDTTDTPWHTRHMPRPVATPKPLPVVDPVCRYCGAPSSVTFCSDECEQLSEWERPGSTDAGPGRFNAFHTAIDTAVLAILVLGALALLAL